MIAAMQFADPGPVGFAVGGLLILVAVAGLFGLRWSARRARAERVAEVGPTYARGVARVPAARPRSDSGRR